MQHAKPSTRLTRVLCLALAMFTAICALDAPRAHAQQEDLELPDIQTQRFRPAPGPADVLNLFSSPVMDHLDWHVGGYIDAADAPLKIATGGDTATDAFRQTVDTQVTLSLLGSIGLYDRVEIGYMLPITLFQNSQELEPILLNDPRFSTDDLSVLGVNDSRLTGKVRILDIRDDPIGLSAIVGLTFPLATPNTLTSDGGIGAEGILAADMYVFQGIRVLANAGFRYRPGSRVIRRNTIGSDIIWGLGAHVPLFFDRLDALVEFDSAINVGADDPIAAAGFQPGEFHAELRGVLRYKFNDWLTFTGGLGAGLSEGVGTPDVRVILGLGGWWVTGGSWGYDYDGDGVYGERDLCPNNSEDFDGHEDFDGCPDLDNDGDGVLDKDDKCDNTPEGVEVKDDGCPDDDLDGDGIPNRYDECPEDLEDRDRFEDSDGCPDPDNDEDGIPDREDNCPNDPEEFNGFLDEDGCPDRPDEKVIISKNKIIITEPVYFATNKDRILDRSKPILDEVARVLAENPQIDLVRIEGHTDSRGRDSYNLDLSQRRANAVREYLIGDGIDRDRLEAVGYGETVPIADNETADGRAKNRRVEFTIVAQ